MMLLRCTRPVLTSGLLIALAMFAPPSLVSRSLAIGIDGIPCDTGIRGLFPWRHSTRASDELCVLCDAQETCDGCILDRVREEPRFKLTEFNIYPTFSYLKDKGATYAEFEFASMTSLGCLEMENRTILNVADLPGTIRIGPQNPSTGSSGFQDVRSQGFGDILSGFFFSPRGAHEQPTHLGLGTVWTFPTATNSLLGADQYTVGPGAHFSAERERMTLGFFLWQSWGFGGGDSVKQVNQLNGKPFIIYELTEKWNAVYIPLGLSHSWDAKPGDDWTVPLGGGIRRLFEVHGQQMGIQMQAFDYVARKPKDPEWELRFTIEFLYD